MRLVPLICKTLRNFKTKWINQLKPDTYKTKIKKLVRNAVGFTPSGRVLIFKEFLHLIIAAIEDDLSEKDPS